VNDYFHTGVSVEHRDKEGKENGCSTPLRFGGGRQRQLPVKLVRRYASHDNLVNTCSTLLQYTQP